MPDGHTGVLALNAGSSSLKFGIYTVRKGMPLERIGGSIESDGRRHRFTLQPACGRPVTRESHGPALQALYALEETRGLPPPAIIGHRIVHGGTRLCEHTRVDDAVLRQLDAAKAFAPLHVPPALTLLREATDIFPGAVQIACLDTAFHRHLPDIARVLPLPAAIREHGVHRVGFHGLSCESIMHQLGGSRPGRVVIAHLGSGCSITAVRDGASVDTSMGLTPTGGTLMASRPGDLDPGILLYLLRQGLLTTAALEDLLEHHSGLRGIAGNGDVRELLAASDSQPMATLALALFVRSVAKHVAAMAITLGGVDLLVFTGGIGENAPAVRAAIRDELAPLLPGLAVQVLPARENDCIARHAWSLAHGPSLVTSSLPDDS